MLLELDLRAIKAIMALVKAKHRYDFENYAMSSIKRRIERIIDLKKIETLDKLLHSLEFDLEFFDYFVREITVNTTEMFRDPAMWVVLNNEVIPNIKIINNLRIWHAGCSTGEEVFSMAILLQEAGLLEKSILYATDLNTNVLASAKKGELTIRNQELNTANYERFKGKGKLADYYTVQDGKMIMNKDLMTNITFKKHDLVLDKSFLKFDLIFCRNVLIYFNMQLQDDVIGKFNDSLFKGGWLILGTKETMAFTKSAKKFNAVSTSERIYQKTAI